MSGAWSLGLLPPSTGLPAPGCWEEKEVQGVRAEPSLQEEEPTPRVLVLQAQACPCIILTSPEVPRPGHSSPNLRDFHGLCPPGLQPTCW